MNWRDRPERANKTQLTFNSLQIQRSKIHHPVSTSINDTIDNEPTNGSSRFGRNSNSIYHGMKKVAGQKDGWIGATRCACVFVVAAMKFFYQGQKRGWESVNLVHLASHMCA